MAVKEAENIAEDRVLVMNIIADEGGYGSLAEAGVAALGALLRRQKYGIHIEDPEGLSKGAIRARALSLELIDRVKSVDPNFKTFDNADSLAEWAADEINEAPAASAAPELPPVSQQLLPFVLLTGPSGDTPDRPPSRQVLVDALTSSETPHVDTFLKATSRFEGSEIEREANIKANAAVVLHSVTKETDSLGAIGETGWLALQAYLNGQAFGVYVEYMDGESKTPSNSARASLIEGLKKLKEDLPEAIHVASSLEDLAAFGQRELAKRMPAEQKDTA